MSMNIVEHTDDYVICKNILHFCHFRGYTPKNYKRPSEQDLLNVSKFEVMCEYNGKPIRIIYVPNKSEYRTHKKLTSMLSDGIDTIVIKNSLIKKINIGMVDSSASITVIDGINLLTNYPKFLKTHGYKIEIVPPEEVDRLMNLYKIPHKKCFSAALNTSLEIVWLGAKLDDIVHYQYPTIASCEQSSNYKIVSTRCVIPDDEEAD